MSKRKRSRPVRQDDVVQAIREADRVAQEEREEGRILELALEAPTVRAAERIAARELMNGRKPE